MYEMGNTMSTPADLSWRSTFVAIKTGHDQAYRAIDQAIELEENNNLYDALASYKNCISRIDETLQIYVEPPTNDDGTWKEAMKMVQALKRARGYVLERINTITTSADYQTLTPTSSNSVEPMTVSSFTYTELATALRDMKMPIEGDPQNKTEILFTCQDVQIYNIRSDGAVTSNSNNVSLHILRLIDETGKIINTSLHVGEWTFPLIPGVSPCLRTSFGAYIIPDLQTEGGAIGIIIPSEADAVLLDLLENLLHGIVHQGERVAALNDRTFPPAISFRDSRHEPGLSDTISHGIVTGAYYLSQGFVIGAQKTGQLLNYVTPRVMSKLRPVDPNSAVSVTPGMSRGVQVAKDVTGAAVEVTGYIAEKVGTATMALGRFLAPHIQKQGAKLLSSGLNLSETEAQEKIGGVLTVAAGAVEGFGTIYSGLEESASILGDNIKNNTVEIVQHSYGSQAGHVVGTGFDTVGNAIVIGKNVSYITPKGLAKKAAKATGKAVVEDYRTDATRSTSQTTYPDLTQLRTELAIKELSKD